MTFNLIQCHPDPHRLAAWATRFGLAQNGNDLGYALHTLLAAAFGDMTPKPFRYFSDARGLLAYSTADAATLQLTAQMTPPDVHGALGLANFAVRDFPSQWPSGRRLAFEVRVRPVIRTHQGRERDTFQLAAEQAAPGTFHFSRETVYGEWLKRELARHDAAVVENVRLHSFQLSTSIRKSHAVNGQRSSRPVTGPDALLVGDLTVRNPNSFAALLTRGIGRHRAFGFGMLLLRPPSAC